MTKLLRMSSLRWKRAAKSSVVARLLLWRALRMATSSSQPSSRASRTVVVCNKKKSLVQLSPFHRSTQKPKRSSLQTTSRMVFLVRSTFLLFVVVFMLRMLTSTLFNNKPNCSVCLDRERDASTSSGSSTAHWNGLG